MRISIKTKAATLFLGIILALGLNLQGGGGLGHAAEPDDGLLR